MFTELPENADLYTNNCEFVHIASGLRCYHLPRTPESFEPGGEVYEDVANGDIIPYSKIMVLTRRALMCCWMI